MSALRKLILAAAGSYAVSPLHERLSVINENSIGDTSEW
ncbi:hypothetical protein SAMN06265222_108226 [Neorhodopirellula lusitana]|uniref:Uncharacterized protein n=1 Tax=Neorhodopirellula lusitana TaxID=445327 RepID=A0ABY1Q9L5_9BACT|nr:hypothetical protein SAMN06265222_108226 [Neorhodopirellula lusitana]